MSAQRRAQRWFWLLFAVAVVAMGALYWAVGARNGPVPAAVVLVSGTVLALSVVQAARIARALRDQLRRHAGSAEAGSG